jgi:cyclic beta-1,2-glucan synthetase
LNNRSSIDEGEFEIIKNLSEKLTQVIYAQWKLMPVTVLEPRIKHMRRVLKKSDEVKEKRLLEKEIGLLLKSCKDFRINFFKSEKGELLPALGVAIASLPEINEETVRETISFIASQKELTGLTSMDVDSFCWQTKFVVIENAVKDGKLDGDYGSKLGALTMLDSEKICRELNPLDKVFSEDPLYLRLTSETKALYREMTSDVSSSAGIDEARLSREYVNSAGKSNRHIGKVITEDERRVFPLMKSSRYIASLFLITAAFTALIAFFTNWISIPLIFFPVFAIVKPVLDLIVSKSIRQRIPLPQIDLKGEIPSKARTLCVISTLLTSPKDVEEVIKRLDVARLKNTSGNLYFCALCDFKADKSGKVSAADAQIIEAVKAKLGRTDYTALIRKREYSKTQRCFQGRERKRGAIESLMKLLRITDFPEAKDDFTEIIGDLSTLVDIKYVCALDYDTVPLMDSISELVGIALHPCHKETGIIAPRITTTLVSSLKTGFSRAMSENGGCAGASSYDSFSGEFYQDCFGEGIFTGKGLLDVDIFVRSCIEEAPFPSETVLSHDILEGGLTGVAYAGDVEFSDSFPETSNAYFKRLHRWLRGDLQNFGYAFDKRFSSLTRFKLFDNVRRAVTPIFIFLCFFAFNNIIALVALTAVVMPFLTGFLPSVIRGRRFSNYRRFYSPVISQTKQLLRQCLMEVLLLPKNALVSLDALLRTVWRMSVSNRRLLDWTTAAAFDGKVGSIGHMLEAALISIVLFSVSGAMLNLFSLIMSVFFLSALPVIFFCDKSSGETKTKLPLSMKRDLTQSCEQIWQFYEDYTTKEHNFLPPDNVQYSPVERVAFRTSPTNIGMYLLSCVAAYVFGFIGKSGLEERVSNTVTTIEGLDKWHGNLCNWYTTDKLEVISPFVSSVDSGNYVCCLVALNEALKRADCSHELIKRIQIQIDETNLKPFYNEARNLFSIGYDLEQKTLSHHHYDLLMSEARMLSYYAIADGQAPKKHWRSLGRVMGKKGKYAAPVAWTGTMFEYYMPELLLSSKEGSMEYEALKFCLRCQEYHGKSQGLPFGISESGFYAFDRSLNYQYKAHGVQDVALKSGMNSEYVVSPYSSFIALSYDPIACYNNLVKLEKLGLCHERYGFYEAADFTKHRVGSGHAIVKSHMAHHMGMSICAVANTLFDGVMQKLFVANKKMKRAEELMEEKIIAGEPVLGAPERQDEKEMRMNADVLTKFNLNNPKLNVLSNGQLSVITSDIGVSQTFYGAKAALFPTFDLYKPRGSLFAFVENAGENENVYPFYNHPSLPVPKEGEPCVVFTQNTSEYSCNQRTLKMSQEVFLDEAKPVEIRSFSAVNKSSVKRNLTLSVYLEPALARPQDISAHPAFMDLFVKLSYDEKEKLFIANRKERDSNDETVMAIGFREEEDFAFSFNREEVIKRNGGIFSCLEKARERTTSTVDVPAPCIFIKTDFVLDAHSNKTSNLFICHGKSEQEARELVREMRNRSHTPEPSEEIISPLVANTIYGRITRRILGNILYSPKIDKEAVSSNKSDVRVLWRYGVSGDHPIVLYEPDEGKPINAVDSVIEMKKALSLCQVEFDLIMLYENSKQRQLYEELRSEINTELFVISKREIPLSDLTLIRAAAVFTLRPSELLQPAGTASSGIIKKTQITPVKILTLNKSKKGKTPPLIESDFVIEETPSFERPPWCNIVANSRFGTLVSEASLGFTWALNSRECKLTPWVNDIRSDNQGELLVMKNTGETNPKLYDLIDGSKAVFRPNSADYYGVAKEVETHTSVRVFERGMGKRVVLELTNHSKTAKQVEIAYYTEPVIGVDRQSASARLTRSQVVENSLVMLNPSNNSMSGAMVLSSDKKAKFLTDKSAFWSGNWNDSNNCQLPIGAVIVKIDLPPRRKEKIKFILSFTRNMNDPLSMEKALKRKKSTATLPTREIDTGSEELNKLYKYWLPWQVIGCRMWARTGFYQNSGAYGFRDQLQDCIAAVLIKPTIAKTQIIRCCTAQFEEGDVLHWWHDLMTTRKGVRTRYSDDLLWLPYVLSDYVEKSNDKEILKIQTRYCTGELLKEHEHEVYSEVGYSFLKESVYQHAKRAMEKGYNKSERGLLHIGGGDWCDGYNRVGADGKGESVWLTMFYALTAKRFSKMAMLCGDLGYAVELESRSAELLKAVDEHAWDNPCSELSPNDGDGSSADESPCDDGGHYLRAFYDDGTKMGSHSCKATDKCNIDLLPQAFSVLAGDTILNSVRVEKALNSALQELYDSENRIIKLFTPPFDRENPSTPDPGYVMSYPVGVRENGGQYTHAAVWLALACHKAGRDDKAVELIHALSPHGRSGAYKTEPYYLSADIYTNPKAYGRGGWSIYTGSAAWYYKVLNEIYGKH